MCISTTTRAKREASTDSPDSRVESGRTSNETNPLDSASLSERRANSCSCLKMSLLTPVRTSTRLGARLRLVFSPSELGYRVLFLESRHLHHPRVAIARIQAAFAGD